MKEIETMYETVYVYLSKTTAVYYHAHVKIAEVNKTQHNLWPSLYCGYCSFVKVTFGILLYDSSQSVANNYCISQIKENPNIFV